MDFSGGSYTLIQPPAFPIMAGFPDISQVRPREVDFFNSVIAPRFNELMESQKWVTERETVAGAYGYENFNLDPELTDEVFVRPHRDRDSVRPERASGAALSQRTLKQNYANLPLDPRNLGQVAAQMGASLEKIKRSIRYVVDNIAEPDARWDYHNAFMISSVGVFRHAEEFFGNAHSRLEELRSLIAGLDAEDEQAARQEQLDGLRAQFTEIRTGYEIVENNEARRRYQFQEAANVASITVLNVSNAATHKSRVDLITELNQDAKLGEKLLEQNQQKKSAQSAQQEKLALQRQKAAAKPAGRKAPQA